MNTWAERNDKKQQEAFELVARAISKHSSLSKENVLRRLNLGKKNTSIQISNRISEAELDKVIHEFREQKLPGLIHNFASMRRIYSKGILAARLMGAVSEESNGYAPVTDRKSLYKLSGNSGIEATYDKVLSGDYGWREIVLDATVTGCRIPTFTKKAKQRT